MNRYVATILAALALTTLPLSGQQDPTARIEAANRRVVAAGIPLSLLESRVAEGTAKGVPLDRIAAAVERRAAALLRAREAMIPVTRVLSEADLSAGADAVEAGIQGRALREVVEQVQAEDRPVALAVLTYLHREQGIPVYDALGQVKEAAKKGSEALRELPAQAAARGRRGPPKDRGPDAVRGQGKGKGGGPPDALPAPGKKPGAGKPPGKGKPGKPGKGKPGG